MVSGDELVGGLEGEGDHAQGHRHQVTKTLVLSLFPGLDLLGVGFELEGFPVVRGPDPVWGGDNRTFHPPPDRFDGVIGGPPCQIHSEMRHLNVLSGQGQGDLVPDFCRVVAEASPPWFLMENVPDATPPKVPGYQITKVVVQALDVPVDGWVGAQARRRRAFWFGSQPQVASKRFYVEKAVLRVPKAEIRTAVLAGHGPSIGQRRNGITTLPLKEAARLQGLPDGMVERLPYTAERARRLIGNGVPVPLARAVARGVIRALYGG